MNSARDLSQPKQGRRPRNLAAWLRGLATYDVFPDFSVKVRRLLYNPLGVLFLAALAALLCGLFLHPQGYVLCGGVVAVIVLGVAWPWLSLRGLRGSIAFERLRASEGQPVAVQLTLRNRFPWTAWGLILRGGFAGQAGENAPESPVVSIAHAPRRRTLHCRWTFVPPCRGVYPLLVPRLATAFPFGLCESRRRLQIEAPLVVWPCTLPVGPVPLAGDCQQVEGNVSRNRVGSCGDVLGVRPYRRGDTPRRIHWGQTARHDRLIVCELQANAHPVVQLVLDADARIHSGTGPESSREWAIRIVASLAKGWLEAGARVGAVWHNQVFGAASGQQHLHALLDGLARLPDEPMPALAELLAGPACRGFCEGVQVIVTTDMGLAEVMRRSGASGTKFQARSAQARWQRIGTGADRQHWVVLRAASFSAGPCPKDRGSEIEHRKSSVLDPRSSILDPRSSVPSDLPVRPWLWVDNATSIPALLRGSWKEAQHGS